VCARTPVYMYVRARVHGGPLPPDLSVLCTSAAVLDAVRAQYNLEAAQLSGLKELLLSAEIHVSILANNHLACYVPPPNVTPFQST